MFLSKDELQELTGLTQGAAQIKWLQREGFSFRVAVDGRPRVLRDTVMSALGNAKGAYITKSVEPRWDLMK